MAQKLHIIHGWTYTLDKWTELQKVLSGKGYEPVMLHVPGLTNPSDEVWSVERYVEWLEGELNAEKQPIVIGHSNGGRIAMAYDQKNPGSLKHLFLIDSAGIFHDETKLSFKRKVSKLLATILKPITTTKMRRVLARFIGASDYGNAKPNMRQTMLNLWEHDKSFDPATVSAPTTIIWGENDTSTPQSDAHVLAQKIENVAGVHIIAGAGHSPQGSHATEVAEIISRVAGE